ncbi:MAG: hypothetical protein ACI97A_001155 [Planctomycetota bacterium]|jgi:hypothetical protein
MCQRHDHDVDKGSGDDILIRRFLNTGQGEPEFRWRGGDVSRIEGLTDGVFAIALTLLVVSLEVPSTWAELRAAFVQMPVFLVCFALLYYIWYSHYIFHRRYGLEDRATVWLNAVLVFLVLFYVYPLKFLAQALYTGITHGSPYQLDSIGNPIADPASTTGQDFLLIIEGQDMPDLMIVYSAGYLGIFLVLALGSWHAWRCRKELELNPIEELITKAAIREQGVMVVFALISLALVLSSRGLAPLGGLVYILVGPVQGLLGWYTGKTVSRAMKNGIQDSQPNLKPKKRGTKKGNSQK